MNHTWTSYACKPERERNRAAIRIVARHILSRVVAVNDNSIGIIESGLSPLAGAGQVPPLPVPHISQASASNAPACAEVTTAPGSGDSSPGSGAGFVINATEENHG